MQNKTVFISRELQTDSIFLRLLTPLGLTVIGESLIDFAPVPFTYPLQTDWLFFYSKNGVKFFFEHLPDSYTLPQLAVIGQSTATYLEQSYHKKLAFVGTGKPQETAKLFGLAAKQQTTTFVQALHSKQSIQMLLGKKIRSKNLVVYQNTPKTNINNPNAALLVFTSPMNAEVYFQNFPYSPKSTIITIGKTTAKALQKLGIEQYHVANAPNEQALAQKVIELY